MNSPGAAAAYIVRKKAGGKCIIGGCWVKSVRGRVKCQKHLDAARAQAREYRTKAKAGSASTEPGS